MNRLTALLLVPTLATSVTAQCLDSDTGSLISSSDDAVVVVNMSHSFTMPDGTSVTSLDVDTNGRITGVGQAGGSLWQTDTNTFLNTPHICPMWADLSPNLGNGLFAYTDANKTVITWDQVQLFGGSVAFDLQVVLRSNNTFTIHHGQTVPVASSIVGSSNGSGAGATTDLSALIGSSNNFGTNTVWEDFSGGTANDLADSNFDYTGGYTVAGTDCMSPPLPQPDIPEEGDTNLPDDTPSNAPSLFVTGLDIEGNLLYSGMQIDADVDYTAFSQASTACNVGSVLGTWLPAPNENHPGIVQNFSRLSDKTATTGETFDRLEQVSDWSWLKHSFGSTNSDECGYGCTPGATFNQLGLGCSDTYGAGLNASRNNSGPPWEWNPFIGDWNSTGSHWDRGFPDPMDATSVDDSQNSVAAPNNVVFRAAIVKNTDIGVPGATYFGQMYYLHRYEPEENRDNNMVHRTVDLSTGGTTFDAVHGSVLNRWPGARVESAVNKDVSNVTRDGRFYVASKVTQLNDGFCRYEYAVHNRDNHGRNGIFTVPIPSGSTVRAAGMKDVDHDPANDWAFTNNGTSVSFTAPSVPLGDPIIGRYAQPWNTIFNFWFETDAAPDDGAIVITQAVPQFDAAGTVSVVADVPACLPDTQNIAPGCGVISMSVTGQFNHGDVTFNITGADPSSIGAAVLIGFDVTASQIDAGLGGFGPAGCFFSLPVVTTLPITLSGAPTMSGSFVLPMFGAELPDMIAQGAVLRVGAPIVGSADVSDIYLLRCR